jgi:c-di-GMP-binding flagellar brake protein YcgR
MARQDDRRRYPRVPCTTCVTLTWKGDELGIFHVLNLSAGGVLLEGVRPAPVGHELTARLHFSPFEIEVGAVVVRETSEQGRLMFALQFELISPEARECVRSLVQAMQQEADAPSPLRPTPTSAQFLLAGAPPAHD